MARHCPLTDPLREEIGRRLAAGEPLRALAREFRIAPSTLSRNFSEQSPKVRMVATALARAELDLLALPVTAQRSARTLADQMRAVSSHLAVAAENGAVIAGHLLNLAAKKTLQLTEDMDPDFLPEHLRTIAAMSATGNEASKIAMSLLQNNKVDAAQPDEGEADYTAARAKLLSRIKR